MTDNQQNGHQRQNGDRAPRGARGAVPGRMRMDEVGNKRKRGEQLEDPYLSLLSSILRLGDRLPVRHAKASLHLIVQTCSIT